MFSLILILLSSNPPPELQAKLDELAVSCAKVGKGCDERTKLRRAWEASELERKEAERAAADAQLTAQYEEAQAAEAAAIEARKARCGKDYQQVRVGMKFKRVADCLGVELLLSGERQGVQRYETARGWVYVRRGVVVGWDRF